MYSRHIARCLTVLAGSSLLAAEAANAQNILVNPSFEQNFLFGADVFLPAGSPNLPGWNVFGEGIAHDSSFQPASGLQTVSTRWNNPGSGLYQDVATVAAQSYLIGFKATRERPQGSPASKASIRGLEVSWNSNIIATIFFAPNPAQTNQNMMWQLFQYNVIGTGGIDRLTFADIDSGVPGYGVELDVCMAEPSPAPGCAALLGLAGLGSLRRRRAA